MGGGSRGQYTAGTMQELNGTAGGKLLLMLVTCKPLQSFGKSPPPPRSDQVIHFSCCCLSQSPALSQACFNRLYVFSILSPISLSIFHLLTMSFSFHRHLLFGLFSFFSLTCGLKTADKSSLFTYSSASII